jgi:hypothetical protein
MTKEPMCWLAAALGLGLGAACGGTPTCAAGDDAAAHAAALAGSGAVQCGTLNTFYWRDGGSFTGSVPSPAPFVVSIGDGGIVPDDGGNPALNCALAAVGSGSSFLLSSATYTLDLSTPGTYFLSGPITQVIAGAPSHQIASFWDGCGSADFSGLTCNNSIIVEDKCSATSASCLFGDAGITQTIVCQSNPNSL